MLTSIEIAVLMEAIGINLPNALLARVRKVVSEATCPSVRAYRLELNMA